MLENQNLFDLPEGSQKEIKHHYEYLVKQIQKLDEEGKYIAIQDCFRFPKA